MTLLSLTGVSLDKPLLPAVLQQTNLMYFERYLILAGLTVFVFLLRNRYFSATRILLDNTIKDDTNAMMSRLCGVIYAARSFAQSMQTLMLTLSERISFPLRSRVQESKLLLDDWTVCRLVAVDNMDADWTKYRFQFDGHASSIVDLDVGQQVIPLFTTFHKHVIIQ